MKRTLTWQVLVVLALAAVLPTAAVGTLAVWRAWTNLEREVVRGHLVLIRELGATLDVRLQSSRRALELAAAQWADDRTAEHPSADPAADPAATRRLVRRLRRHVPLFASISIFDVHGNPVGSQDVAVDNAIGAHSFGGYIGDVQFADGHPRIRMVAQARSRTGELVGTFVAQLDLGFISEALGNVRLGPGAHLLVVDGRGVPVARTDRPPGSASASLRGSNPAVDRALGEAVEGTLTADGLVSVYRNLASYQSLRGVPWAIILQQPERQAYALAHATTANTIAGAAIALAVALVVGAALAARLTSPLAALAARADVIARDGGPGELAAAPGGPARSPLGGPGEIGLLAERLELMARRLAERDKLKDALARGDRLAAVGTMSASIAHEINNPLTTVLGYAKLLLEDKLEDHPDRPGLELIAEEAARMQRIVRGLLDYARADTGDDSEATDINELAEKTEALLGPDLRRRQIDVELSLTLPLPRAAIDEHSLQQVFVNLANNAAQAMDHGGRLTIASGLGPGGATVHVQFIDTGPGVPTADRERIFDPFFTTKEVGAGTGLGLAVARHLVTRRGGSLRVEEGSDHRGACFRVVLPTAEQSE
jgi:signal transduction histidine kinase